MAAKSPSSGSNALKVSRQPLMRIAAWLSAAILTRADVFNFKSSFRPRSDKSFDS